MKSRINFDVLEITDFSKTKGLLVKVDIEKSIWFCRPKKYDQFNRNTFGSEKNLIRWVKMLLKTNTICWGLKALSRHN